MSSVAHQPAAGGIATSEFVQFEAQAVSCRSETRDGCTPICARKARRIEPCVLSDVLLHAHRHAGASVRSTVHSSSADHARARSERTDRRQSAVATDSIARTRVVARCRDGAGEVGQLERVGIGVNDGDVPGLDGLGYDLGGRGTQREDGGDVAREARQGPVAQLSAGRRRSTGYLVRTARKNTCARARSPTLDNADYVSLSLGRNVTEMSAVRHLVASGSSRRVSGRGRGSAGPAGTSTAHGSPGVRTPGSSCSLTPRSTSTTAAANGLRRPRRVGDGETQDRPTRPSVSTPSCPTATASASV